jgi:hypothetical protein
MVITHENQINIFESYIQHCKYLKLYTFFLEYINKKTLDNIVHFFPKKMATIDIEILLQAPKSPRDKEMVDYSLGSLC